MGGALRFVKARPLACFALCYAMGLCAGGFWAGSLWVLPALTGAALGAGMIFRRRGFVFLAAALLGAARMSFVSVTPTLPRNGRYTVEATVISAQVEESGRCVMRVSEAELDGEGAPGNMLLYVQSWQGSLPRRGDRVAVYGYVFPAAEGGAASPFTWRGYTLRKRVYMMASGHYEDYRLTEEGGWSLMRALDGARGYFSRVVDELYPRDAAPLVKSLTLGLRDELPENVSGEFDAAGAVHLLALSGLHVSLLAALVERILSRLRMTRRMSFFFSLGLLTAYMLMVGAPASILRAGVMYALVGAARIRRRPYDSLTGLAAAFLALTVFTPRMALDPGMLLSFSAMLGILLTAPLARVGAPKEESRWGRMGRTALSSLLASLGATLGTLPLSAAMYQTVHPYSALVNLILIPVTSLALPVGYVSVILGSVCLPLGVPFAWAGGYLFRGLVGLVSLAAKLPGAVMRFRNWNWALTPFLALCLALASPYAHPPRGRGLFRWAALGCAVMVAVTAVSSERAAGSPVSITFVDVGQGDGAVIRVGDVMYAVDAGGGEETLAYLKSQEGEVAGVFLTHPHDDHAGGAMGILEEYDGTLYVPAGWEDMKADGDLDSLTGRALALGWPVRHLKAGDEVELGMGVTARALWPRDGKVTEDANDTCLVLLISWGEADALFLADLPAGPEPALPRAEVLKAAHHGAGNGTTALTAAQVCPGVAVISVGLNSYGHPSPGVVDMLEAGGTRVYRTDRQGDIEVELFMDGTARVWTQR